EEKGRRSSFMRYIIVTGQSGAGKTACVHYLEDQGSFCMDNMPPMMLPRLVEAFSAMPMRQTTVTIAMDVRSGEFFDAHAVAGMISELRKMGHRMDIIFLEASDETLLDRYKESRRDHPLTQEGLTLMEAITEERVRLQPLREAANYVVDTTGLRSRALASLLKKKLSQLSEETPAIRAEVMSFGFKRGLPRQADLVMDVRFLPNPFYIEELRQHCGLDSDVRDFVMQNPATQEFLEKWKDMLRFLIPHYQEEGKHRLVIAVGCTGGAHRSVALAEAIGEFLRETGMPTEVSHRDLQLEQARWGSQIEE
ncbi:MAG: RNase adapter RapZ, partial [Clostridiales bacterium]|nr:RNase adapter RapZ [Clostridiales bacterium]